MPRKNMAGLSGPGTTESINGINNSQLRSIICPSEDDKSKARRVLREWADRGIVAAPDDWDGDPYEYILDILGLNDRKMIASKPFKRFKK